MNDLSGLAFKRRQMCGAAAGSENHGIGLSRRSMSRVTSLRRWMVAPWRSASRVRLVMMPPNSARVGRNWASLPGRRSAPRARAGAPCDHARRPRRRLSAPPVHHRLPLFFCGLGPGSIRIEVPGRSPDAGCRRSKGPAGNADAGLVAADAGADIIGLAGLALLAIAGSQ